MSFTAVWGFDPDEVMRAQQLHRLQDQDQEEKSEEVDSAQEYLSIPAGADAQLYELRRMFRLWR